MVSNFNRRTTAKIVIRVDAIKAFLEKFEVIKYMSVNFFVREKQGKVVFYFLRLLFSIN